MRRLAQKGICKWFSNLSGHKNHLGSGSSCRLVGCIPRDSESAGLGWSRACAFLASFQGLPLLLRAETATGVDRLSSPRAPCMWRLPWATQFLFLHMLDGVCRPWKPLFVSMCVWVCGWMKLPIHSLRYCVPFGEKRNKRNLQKLPSVYSLFFTTYVVGRGEIVRYFTWTISTNIF